MGCEPDQWAKNWLEEQRKKGETGLTIEKKGSVHYLKWATTVWDPENKKRKKISEYRGVLNPDGTVTEPRPRRDRSLEISDIRDMGNAMFLAEAAKPFLEPLKKSFPRDHAEMILLAFARCLGKGELNKAGRCWKKLDDVLGLRPNTDPASLSETLERIGKARGCQDMFFDRIYEPDGEVAVDLSVMFSKAKGASIVKYGYSSFKTSKTQFNVLLVCGIGTGRPRYIKALAGDIHENSIGDMLDEFEISAGTLLIMDSGYASKDIMKELEQRGLDFLVPVKRDSLAYMNTNTDDGMFLWKRNVVSFGKGTYDGKYAYRFENMAIRNDELADSVAALEEKNIPIKDADKAGNLILLSSRDMEPKEAYRLYKLRCTIENCFDTAKNVLSADKTHMSSDEKIMGHVFITFLSFCIWTEMSVMIENAKLGAQYTVSDVLDIFSSVKRVIVEGEDVRQLVRKEARELDQKLKTFFFSEEHIPQKRGPKPKDPKPATDLTGPRKRGRPRKNPIPDPNAPPKKRGRPKKGPAQ
jgi:hypothetical protein